MKFIIGIDGGGSKIVCLAANERGELLGCGRGGPVNTNYVLYREAFDSATQAIETALKKAGLDGIQIDAAVISAPIDPGTLEKIIKQCHIKKITRAAEGETSRWAARFWIEEHIGVTVDAGTGSLSRGWTKDGRVSGAGGFGATLGDEGSGVWIALKAVSAVLQAYDGRIKTTSLTEPILKHFNIQNVQDLIFIVSGGFVTTAKMRELKAAKKRMRFAIDSGHVIGQTFQREGQGSAHAPRVSHDGGLFFRQFQHTEPVTRHELARLCPIVVEEARHGDQVAIQILEQAGFELGRLACAVIERLEMQKEAFAIVPFGGVFKAGELVLGSFREKCLSIAPYASITHPKFEPEVGAVLIALDEIGTEIDDDLIGNLERSSLEFPGSRTAGSPAA